jgi:hypothetical protein
MRLYKVMAIPALLHWLKNWTLINSMKGELRHWRWNSDVSCGIHIHDHKTYWEDKDELTYTVKGKFRPVTVHEGSEREYRYSSILSLTSSLDGCGWSTPRPNRFTLLGKKPGTHCTVSWVGPRASLDEGEKSLQTVQPVANGHTDWAIVAHQTHTV